jgi:cystathionine beta-lyase/cystathionine gamma-synthase
VPSGGHVILADDGYGGTQRYFRRICHEKHGIGLSFVDMTRLEKLKKALKPNTKVPAKIN